MQKFVAPLAEPNSSRTSSPISNSIDYKHFQLDSDLKSPPRYVLRDGYLQYHQQLS